MDAKLKEYLSGRIEEHIHLLPEHIRDSMRLYVFEKLEPGGFLTAILANDLKGAVMRADSINKMSIPQYVEFCTWALPMACWGSYEKVSQWLKPEEAEEVDDGGYTKENPPRVADFIDHEGDEPEDIGRNGWKIDGQGDL